MAEPGSISMSLTLETSVYLWALVDNVINMQSHLHTLPGLPQIPILVWPSYYTHKYPCWLKKKSWLQSIFALSKMNKKNIFWQLAFPFILQIYKIKGIQLNCLVSHFLLVYRSWLARSFQNDCVSIQCGLIACRRISEIFSWNSGGRATAHS